MRASILRRHNYQPWIWKLVFPKVPFKNTLFTWGCHLYTDLEKIPDDLIIHENVHSRQQLGSRFVGFFLIFLYKWCRPYRRYCEVEAHLAQARYLKKGGQSYFHIMKSLSSPLYGIMTESEAYNLLKEI